MRQPARLYAHDAKGMIPRMSWSIHNLYNLIARSTLPMHVTQIAGKQVSLTMYQQRWRAKRLLRGYHGDWIGEKKFKRWYLPTSVPRMEGIKRELTSNGIGSSSMSSEEKNRVPIASLFMRDVERRLDTIVFRCCFAKSARQARTLILQGHVRVNGSSDVKAGMLLNPGDLVSIDPQAVPMLGKQVSSKRLAKKEENFQKWLVKKRAEEAAAAKAAEESGESVDKAEAVSKTSDKPERDPDLDKPGVLAFRLPDYAAPFLFIPPYLEVSFTTCSAIYLRHPTITPAPKADNRFGPSNDSVLYNTDIPSPYPATGDIFSLVWEHYTRDAPRIRGDVRRLRLEARVGRLGLRTARAKDQWRKVKATRKRRDRDAVSAMQSDDLLVRKTAQEALKDKRMVKTAPKLFVVGRDGGPVQKRLQRPPSPARLSSPEAKSAHEAAIAS